MVISMLFSINSRKPDIITASAQNYPSLNLFMIHWIGFLIPARCSLDDCRPHSDMMLMVLDSAHMEE